MTVFRIEDPVKGEQVVAVQPGISRHPVADWQQRLAFFTGRALTHSALHLEQANRSGHTAILGQAYSSGTVEGLHVSAADVDGQVILEIEAGSGLAANGEVVYVNRNREVPLDNLRVFAPATLLEDDAGLVEEGPQGAYKLGGTLAELRAAGRALPRAMVVVLQPATVEHFSDPVSDDPCDYDPTDEAFENWQWLDAGRLVLFAWTPLTGALPVDGAAWRNRMAHTIFDQERGLHDGDCMPWEPVGVAVALVGLDATLDFEFIDNHAVRRQGGEARGTALPVTPLGNRFLWQARFEQFNEQLVDWLTVNPALDPEQMQAIDQFRQLPPVGVLPAASIAARQQSQRFFPLGYAVQALVIPYEQLDLAVSESAGLLPYDLNTPDRVEVLLPVPQRHFDPRLLVVENLDPEFNTALDTFVELRDAWLGRRLAVRERTAALYKAIKGRVMLFPADDANAIDASEQAAEFEQHYIKVGDPARYFKGRSAPPTNWLQNSFNDTAWEIGTTAIGYSQSGLGTDLNDMRGSYVTVYIRHKFSVAALERAHHYSLKVTTHGGFYAYLNGRELQANNVRRPGHTAPAGQAQELIERHYELGDLVGHLTAGENVLAIEAHNAALDAESFSISVELLDTEDHYGTQAEALSAAAVPGQIEVEAFTELRNFLDTNTPLSDVEVAKLDEKGIEDYIDFLQQKINRADDKVEFGFLRLRTDIYRVRQLILGNEAGTKLATSPALAEIAEGVSAVATKQELSDFYSKIKRPVVSGVELDGTDTPSEGRFAPLSAELSAAMSASLVASTSRNNIAITGTTVFPGAPNLGRFPGGGFEIPGEIADGIKGDIGGDVFQSPLLKERSVTDLFSTRSTKSATSIEIGEQNPLVGKTQTFNNVTVGERLKESSANVSLMAGISAKGEILQGLLFDEDSDGINLDDLSVPGFKETQGDDDNPASVDVSKTFAEIRNEGLIGQILNGQHDPVDADDESGYFSSGIRALENGVGILRIIEGRVHAYRSAVQQCKETIAEIQRHLSNSDRRLKVIGDELAEARHDASVARALKTEEQARIDALNESRDKVLQSQVPFVLFRRPRTVDPRLTAPLHFVNPDLSEQPLPLCDLSEVEAPEALEAMMDVLREAPLKWFTGVKPILSHLSRLPDLQVTLAGAKKRAAFASTVHPYNNRNFGLPDQLLRSMGATLDQSRRRIKAERRKTQEVELAAYQRLGWMEAVIRIPEVVSLGDVIDGNHGRSGASRLAVRELHRISNVATCLYVSFSAVPAIIRLDWAERFSQFDGAINLRNLYSLPRFAEIEYIERTTMQRQVDWLYSRVNNQIGDARDMVSDLLRVLVLTASHAPVNQLIAAQLTGPVTVGIGSHIRVISDLGRVRIGMAVSIVSAGDAMVRGRVLDIAAGEVIAEVHTVPGKSVQLNINDHVMIGERTGLVIKR